MTCDACLWHDHQGCTLTLTPVNRVDRVVCECYARGESAHKSVGTLLGELKCFQCASSNKFAVVTDENGIAQISCSVCNFSITRSA